MKKKRGVTWRNEAMGRSLANVRNIPSVGRARPMAGQLAKLREQVKESEAKIKMYKLLLKTATYDPMLMWRFQYHIDNYQKKMNAAQDRMGIRKRKRANDR